MYNKKKTNWRNKKDENKKSYIEINSLIFKKTQTIMPKGRSYEVLPFILNYVIWFFFLLNFLFYYLIFLYYKQKHFPEKIISGYFFVIFGFN